MRTINAKIFENEMKPDSTIAGMAGDNLNTKLVIEIPDSWAGYIYRLKFKTSTQSIDYAYISESIPLVSGKIEFLLPSSVMIAGKLQVQASAEKSSDNNTIIVNSATMTLDVIRSIGAECNEYGFPPNYSGLIDQTLAEIANTAADSAVEIEDILGNELYGEALHLEYEVGGFDASLGQVNTKVRARPVDKAILVRKGMRITGGGTYQVDVTAVDAAGAVVKHLCSYADEYVMQADGYIRYTVKSIENPTAELTEADLPAIAEKVVILNDNSMDKRLEALEESDRFWATSGTWDIRQGSSGSDYTQNANGNVDVPADTVLYRDAVTDLLFQKLTWTFKVNTVGAFAFGTRDGSGAANGYYVLVNPADKTLKIYNSDWEGTLSIKRNLTIDFDILAGETYYAEIIKTGTLSTEFTLKCISAPGKTFSYTHNQLNNKLRGWGGVAFGSAGGVFELVNMTQKARSEAECEVLLIGDSFLENASSELESEYAYAYKLREKLGEKLIASGRGGATTAALKNKYTTDFLAAKAKYTVLQIGSNDSLSLTVATFKMNLLELIGRVEENGSIPVLVTIPRRYDTDNTAFITEANAWIKSLGYWYIDEYALLPADRLLNDTIHPNAEGHDLILSNLLALIPV